jgi:hypothetical protein
VGDSEAGGRTDRSHKPPLELTQPRTLAYLRRRLAHASRIAEERERWWVIEAGFRILGALAGLSAAAVRQLAAGSIGSLCFTYLRDMQQLVPTEGELHGRPMFKKTWLE